MAEIYDWVEFYEEFANKLLDYKNKRKDLVNIVINLYKEIKITLPTLEAKDQPFEDICPFTVFGLFNKSSLKEENRIKIINAFAEKFKIQAPIPTGFSSIPVLNNQNATFYYFLPGRNIDDINNLWNLFEAALNYSKNQNKENENAFARYFDLVINAKGNGNSKVTMGLYWIAPNFFVSIDSRNTWYIYETGKIPAEVVSRLPQIEGKISSENYLKITKELHNFTNAGNSNFPDFKSISFEAWRYSEEVNQKNKLEKQNNNNERESALVDDDNNKVHYWLYAPGNDACKWDEFHKKGIMAIGWGEIGDLTKFATRKEMLQKMKEVIDPTRAFTNDSLATWQFVHDMKIGDVIFVKKGLHKIVGRGIVTSDYTYNPNEKEFYNNIRNVKWSEQCDFEHPGQAVLKTLTDITNYTNYVNKLNTLFEDELEENIEIDAYTSDNFLTDVYMTQSEYDNLVELLFNKKNIILQGAPGVGKTFVAKRLAYSIMGEKNSNRVELVQFHQSYSYEDFIEGYRPTPDGSEFYIKKGTFCKFCEKAANDIDNDYFFIIDEINRGNISKIFGELFMLIEQDKRGNALKLLYSDDNFIVPKNVYIIGMMNTADRSLALIDYALRRRFGFYDMKPAFQSENFRKYRMSFENEKFNRLIECIEKLNEIIKNDDSLGEGFCIGHSYFCGLETIDNSTLNRIIEYEIIPLLKEYWFDEPSKIADWSENLRGSIK